MMHSVIHELPAPEVMASELRQALPTFAACDWVETTTSTNNDLMAMTRDQGSLAAWPRLRGAHHQTQGKGRLGRTWLDTPGMSLMFSCGFALPVQGRGSQALQGLGPAIGLVSAQTLRTQLDQPDEIKVKWPNDLMFGHGKVGGVLIEANIKSDVQHVIIGIGLNLGGHAALSTTLGREIGAIGQSLRPSTSLSQVVVALASCWHDALVLNARAGFEPFVDAFCELDYLAGRSVDLIQQDQVIATGVACGAGPDGQLQVKTANGTKRFMVGDVSVRAKHPI